MIRLSVLSPVLSPVLTAVLSPALVLALIGTLVFTSVQSQAADEAPLPADVRVIIDVSGSMKQNDPANLRQPAVELLVQLLPDGSKAGIWTFGRYINMLVKHREVNDQWKRDATQLSADINSVGLYTNIGEALEKATYDYDRPNPGYQTSLILLTDGMVDIDKDPQKNQQEWRRLVDEVLPRLQQSGYKVHTVALSENADTALMDKLALGTDGLSEVANSADDLMKIFLRIFDQAAPSEQVPLEGNTFLVDSSIEEFTALIFPEPTSEPTRLIAPDDTEYRFDKEMSDANWYRTDDYDLITIQRPLEGEWKVIADLDPDSRVTVVSNLNLLVKPLPTNLFADQVAQLSVLFQEQNKTITDRDFLSLLKIDGAIDHQESSEHWDRPLSNEEPPRNGIYTSALDMFQEEGRYQVSVAVDGKSFQRQFKHNITVRQPFAVELEKQINAGREEYNLTVRAHGELVDPANTQVVARIKDPEGRSSIKPLQLTQKDDWQLLIKPETEGRYQVRLRISGDDRNGESFNFDPGLKSFTYPSEDNPFAQAAEVMPEPEPIAEVEKEPAVEDPVEEPAPAEPEVEAEITEEEPAEEESVEEESSWPLYVGLGIGNLLIIALAVFAYRMVMGSGKGDSLKELEEAVAEAEAEDTEPAESKKPAQEAPEAPVPEMQEISEVEPIEDGMDMEEMPMDDGLDLSSDDVTEAELPTDAEQSVSDSAADEQAADDLLAGLDEGEASAEEGDSALDDAMEGFSLDDFAPDSLDEDEDEEGTPKE
ncbi:MAG: VWA domain-containing protein [Cellvibrionaceae bacterium]